MQKALIFVGGVALGVFGSFKLTVFGLGKIIEGKKGQTWLMHRGDHYEKWRVYETTTPKGTTGGYYVVTGPDVKYEEKEATADETGSYENSADNSKAADKS